MSIQVYVSGGSVSYHVMPATIGAAYDRGAASEPPLPAVVTGSA